MRIFSEPELETKLSADEAGVNTLDESGEWKCLMVLEGFSMTVTVFG